MSSPSLKVSGRLYQNVLVVLGAGLLALSSLPVALAQASESASASAEASSATPSAGPEVPKKENCTIDEKSGKEICGLESKPGTLPGSAKAAIVIVVLTVVFLLLATIFYIRRSRRAAAEADKEVAVEESQMTGPAHVLNATYTPETGHSRVYSIGPDSGALSASVPVPLTPALPPPHMAERNQPQTPAPANGTPAFPSPIVTRPSLFSRWGSTANTTGDSSATTQPQTAPANKATFATFDPNTYPFSGFGNSNGNGSSSATPPKSAHPPVQPRSAFVSSGGFPRPLLAGRLKDRIRERPPSVSSLTVESPNK